MTWCEMCGSRSTRCERGITRECVKERRYDGIWDLCRVRAQIRNVGDRRVRLVIIISAGPFREMADNARQYRLISNATHTDLEIKDFCQVFFDVVTPFCRL